MHEAGFDSYLTGFLYGKMMYKRNKDDVLKVKNTINVYESLFFLKTDGEDVKNFNSLMFIFRLNE